MEYNDLSKLKGISREWLHGIAIHDRQYYEVLETLEACIELFDGRRNDGQVEAIHPIGVFQHLRIHHRDIRRPVLTYKAALMHDALEDKRNRGVSEAWLDRVIGGEATEKVILLTKEDGYDEEQYHARIWGDEVASLAKGGDRVNNNSTAIKVYKLPRLHRYMLENKNRFLPGFKISRQRFPDQAVIYQSMKMIVYSQVQAMERVLEGFDPTATAS